MKNNLLLALLLCSTVQASEKLEESTNAFELVMAHYKTTPFDLGFWQHAGIIGGSTMLSAGAWLATRAIATVFNPKTRNIDKDEMSILDIKSWSLAEKIVTPASFVLFAKLIFDEQTPEGIAYNANKSGLLNALLACSTQEEIQSILDRTFIAESFPRAAAFVQVNIIRDALKRVLGLVSTMQASKPNKHFQQIVETLSTNINLVETTLLFIKSDSRWFEECNAINFSRAQATQQADFNAKLAGSAIHLAHAYAK